MEEINEIQSYIVNGYVFETKTEYNEAVQEKKAIKYLSSELNLSNIEKTYKLYCELIEKKIFKTPVGMDYLKKLRDVVIKSGNYKAEDIMPIPVKTTGHMEKERVEKIKERITDALEKTISVDYDKNRLEQELIYYIEKLDINEEKQRLSNHLKYFINTMEDGSGQGKKLGFIAQEMGREINTLGSKSNHAEMQKIVVQMKDELEQIKEQVLNVM